MFTFSVPNCPRHDSQTVGAGVGVGVGGVEGGGGCRKSDEEQSMTWIRMSKSWDDVGRSQKDSHGQPGTAG